MARIPLVTRDEVAANEQAAFDAFAAGRGGPPKVGPYTIIAHMPEMAQRLEALRLYIRKEASLSQHLQELVMISVAREMNCGFIWYAHAAEAKKAGVRGDIVDAVRERRPLTNLTAEEKIATDFTRELLQNRKVSKSTYDAAIGKLGRRAVLTLTNLIACYAVLAYNMNTFELEAPDHATEPRLPV